ncbi:MAG: hypothetical protein ACOC1O_03415 [bacterium]
MEFKGLKINVIILVIMLVIVMFFFGQYIINIYNINKPLQDEINSIDGINSVQIEKEDNKTNAIVSFESNIHFYDTYREIEKIMDKRLGSNTGQIVINKVAESKDLKDIYYKLHFAIYEGINTSKFVQMSENVKLIAEKNKINNYKVWVDEKAVYLQLNKGENSLYRRIPNYRSITINSQEGGAEVG